VPRHPVFLAALAPLLLGAAGCAGAHLSTSAALERADLQARLAARAAAMLGQGLERFQVGGEAFNADCSGFVEAVYAAEGISLRRVLQAAAPHQASAVAAAWEAAGAFGERWRHGEWPAPGDLVFFDDTWDRNGNGRRDDPLTHLGIVEWTEPDGTVRFFHRASRGVVRGVVTLSRPATATDASGRPLNSPLRARAGRDDGAPSLAGQLLVGFGRIDVARALAAARR